MKTLRFASLLGPLLFATACVTINVYFPTAQAVEAADQIIRGVYGEEAAPAPDAAPESAPAKPAEPQSSLPGDVRSRPLFVRVLDWTVKPAHAAANMDISSPAIARIRASMEARFSSLKAFYDAGSVGMTRDGLIAVRDMNAVPLPQRKTVNALVADENRDRNALYAEIARANGHPEWESDIRNTFAKRWVDNAPGGWWYQDGGWKQK